MGDKGCLILIQMDSCDFTISLGGGRATIRAARLHTRLLIAALHVRNEAEAGAQVRGAVMGPQCAVRSQKSVWTRKLIRVFIYGFESLLV